VVLISLEVQDVALWAAVVERLGDATNKPVSAFGSNQNFNIMYKFPAPLLASSAAMDKLP
jgi:hypothetical protein